MSNFIGIINTNKLNLDEWMREMNNNGRISNWCYSKNGLPPNVNDKIFICISGKKGYIGVCEVVTNPQKHIVNIQENSDKRERSARLNNPKSMNIQVRLIKQYTQVKDELTVTRCLDDYGKQATFKKIPEDITIPPEYL